MADTRGPAHYNSLPIPSVVDLGVIKEIQTAYLSGWMKPERFSQWMLQFCPEYCTDASPEIFALWGDVPKVKRHMTRLSQRDVIPEGYLSTGKKGNVESVDLPAMFHQIGVSLDTGRFRPTNTQNLVFYQCPRHEALHLRVRLTRSAKRAAYKLLNFLFPYSSAADKQQTRQDLSSFVYHLTRTAADAEELARWERSINVAFANIPIGMFNITMLTHCILSMGTGEYERITALVSDRAACCLSSHDYIEFWKAVSVAVRRSFRWFDGTVLNALSVAQLCYLHMPVGRSEHTSDWAQEKINRSTPIHLNLNLGSPLNFGELLRAERVKIAGELVNRRPILHSFVEHVQRRQLWVAGGSSGGARVHLEATDGGDKVRLNKTAYFEQLDTRTIVAWLHSPPVLQAVASEKFEMGKARAIYATMPKDYTIASYFMAPLENRMNDIAGVEQGLRGADQLASVSRRCARARTRNVETTMLDYKDFNLQHSLREHKSLLDAIADALED